MEARFFDHSTHQASLLALAASRLRQGDARSALMFADRHIRISGPSVRNLLLRARARRQLGHAQAAAKDLLEACDLNPTSPLVNSYLLDWGTESEKAEAAQRLIEADGADKSLVQAAILFLLKSGRPYARRIRFAGSARLSGWIVWAPTADLALEADAGDSSYRFNVSSDPSHRFAALGLATDLTLHTPAAMNDLRVLINNRVVEQITIPLPIVANLSTIKPLDAAEEGADVTLQIIVPVYMDLNATRYCLEALSRQMASFPNRVIIVDDAIEDRALSDYLVLFCKKYGAFLIRNHRNLGFVGAVNEALKYYVGGDILLLNSDTVLPDNAIARLHQVAYLSHEIGTVTPFSNNGEFTSFPTPFSVNPMLSREEINDLDAYFASQKQNKFVPIPSGVGFCLFIKGETLRAVGRLSEKYAPGYGEDIEFCLAAREQGFLNVCATNVYVGHAGGRSFRAAKRALVVRNLGIVDERFPTYRAECAAFLHADPLKPARARVEAIVASRARIRLLIQTSRRAEAAVRERAAQIARDTSKLTILVVRPGAGKDSLQITAEGFLPPKSLSLALRTKDGLDSFATYLKNLALERIEIFDPEYLTPEWAAVLAPLGVVVDLACIDAWPIRIPRSRQRTSCTQAAPPNLPCNSCVGLKGYSEAIHRQLTTTRVRLAELLTDGSRVLCLDPMSEAVARRTFSSIEGISITAIRGPSTGRRSDSKSGSRKIAPKLAVLMPTRSADADRLIVTLQRIAVRLAPSLELFVFGACMDDLRIFASGNAFVNGPVAVDEYPDLLTQHGIERVLSPYRNDHFWVFNHLGSYGETRKAYFDWSYGAVELDRGDLPMDPRICDAIAAGMLAAWLLADGDFPESQLA